MVRRKPVGQGSLVPAPLGAAANNPPYPLSPTAEAPARAPPAPPTQDQVVAANSTLHPASSFEIIGKPNDQEGRSDNEDSDSDWDKDDTEDEDEPEQPALDIPPVLKVGSAGGSGNASPNLQSETNLPATLRVGPPGGVPQLSQESLVSEQSANPWSSTPPGQRRPSVPLQSNNPYLRMQNSGQSNPSIPSNPALASSSSIWADLPPITTPPQMAPVELPATTTPIEPHTQDRIATGKQSAVPQAGDQSPHRNQAPLLSVEAENSSDAIFGQAAPAPSQPQHDPWADQLDHLDQMRIDDTTAKELAHMNRPAQNEPNPWREGEQNADLLPDLPPRHDETSPAQPPRAVQQPPQQPPRPPVDTSVSPVPQRSTAVSPDTQRKEHYSIKHTRWYDDSIGQLRELPILIQNANGPCPLLALVNALVLSTPAGAETALIEALRTREQVSLGLLLDAVFDELTSGRRGSAAQELPDVGDLYQFLLALHTGMNVNPRFVPTAIEVPNLMDADGPIKDVHPALRQPGGFEQTRETRLYSTFNIPIIHGWLPTKGSEAYAAFERAAPSFDEALNIQFREEELEEKLRTSGLSPDEIKLFEDITSIKEFLERWPTQLTSYGLDVIRQHLQPGGIAIFFRNDHFSTLYKDPKSGRLMALVTDAGYATHDEIVWESLVDVNGAGGELFSGDFRPVGGPSGAATSSSTTSPGPAGPRASSSRPVRSMLNVDTNDGWQTVSGKRRAGRSPRDSGQDTGVIHSMEDGPLSPTGESETVVGSPMSATREEQEDHDLALALQLQEEEDLRNRERREREDRLSRQFLEGEGRTPNAQDIRPMIPPRRNQQSSTTTQQPSSPPTGIRRTSEAEEDAPPPTYEQASRRPAFVPPRDHPASPHAPVGTSTNSSRPSRPQGGAYAQSQSQQTGSTTGRRRQSTHLVDRIPSGTPGSYPVGMGRGRGRGAEYGGIGQGYSQPVGEDRDKCVVM